ncbi:MAG: GNAT family N-acetyltransferase [Flavobacteriia bacterium]|nr:GNAT family N-acetyltransferase [Flavobacteriia bacterium]
MICELALFEKALNEVINTPEALKIHLFDDHICDALVVEFENKIIGFALYYTSYSTWRGKCLYLEDFYVKPNFRGSGIGSLLFDEIVLIARTTGVKRMDWQVLDWNEAAIEFYKYKKATLDPEWINGRLYF